MPLSETGRAYYGDNLEGSIVANDFLDYTANGTVAQTLNSDLATHIQKLNSIRMKVPALRKGQYTVDGNYVSGNMAFIRRYTGNGIDSLALVTISSGATFKNIPNGKYVDVVSGDVKNVTNGTLTVNAPGQGNLAVYVCCADGFTAPDTVMDMKQYNLSFDANGGEGVMESLEFTSSRTVVLPECTFAAPEDSVFQGWQIEGKLYQPGETVTRYWNSTAKAMWSNNAVSIIIPSGGNIAVDKETPATGEDVTITVTPDTGKEVDQVIVTDKDGNNVDVTANEDGSYTYKQPEGDVTIEVTFKDETVTPPSAEDNEVIINPPSGGNVAVDKETPATGEDVTITVTPDTGKEVNQVIVTDKDGNNVDVTANEDGSYTYKQPEGDVTIEVTFRDEAETYPVSIGGVAFDDDNLTIIDENGGTATYDPETNTLTLDGYSVSNENGEGIKAEGDLTLAGNGIITGSTYGIYTDGMLSIEEGSNIVFHGETAAVAIGDGIGMANIIVTVPDDSELGSVKVGEDAYYTTYGTDVWNEETGESVFIPAKTVRVEPGFQVFFDTGESMDYIEDQEVVAGGKAVKPADPALEGYTFGGWYIDSECTEAYDFDTAVTENLWLYAKWNKKTSSGSNSSGGFSGSYNYPIKEDKVDGAKVTFSDEYAGKGETVTITVTPDAGKKVDEVIITDANGKVIPVTKVGDNQYSFTMLAGKVNVEVTTKAADYSQRIVMQIGNTNIAANDKTKANDVAPFIVGDRTLVPIRIVTELLGGSAHWDDATRTVTLYIDGKVLSMTIGKEIPGFGTSAVIMNDRTYVPIRYVAEKLGANVEWIAATQQIVIEK